MRRRFLMKDVAIVVLICLLVISVGLNVGLYRKIQSEKTWISGHVKDTVVGAIIKARTSTAKGVSEKSTITDVDGYYELILSAGEWNVTLSMDYYSKVDSNVINAWATVGVNKLTFQITFKNQTTITYEHFVEEGCPYTLDGYAFYYFHVKPGITL